MKTYINRLRRRGYIATVDGATFGVTMEGSEWLTANAEHQEAFAKSAKEILDIWRESFLAGERKIFDRAIEVYPRAVPKEEIAELLGIGASGSTMKTYVNRLARAGVIRKVKSPSPGIVANENLFLLEGAVT
jgi:predicted transcriptional regulator